MCSDGALGSARGGVLCAVEAFFREGAMRPCEPLKTAETLGVVRARGREGGHSCAACRPAGGLSSRPTGTAL